MIKKKNRNYWNYETCKEAASICKSRGEFWDKYSRAATLSSKNNWLDDFFQPNLKKPRGYWTYETCFEEAKKYNLYTTFRDESFTVYDKCMKNGWIKDFTWLFDNRNKYDKTSRIHKIYVYVFDMFNAAYVGRTIQIKQRHYTHTKGGKKDGLKDFITKHEIKNVDLPTILENNLTLEESKIKEQYWMDKYKDKGYELINKVKGGSIGGIATKWDRNNCYKEALKYTKRMDFYVNSPSAWVSARKNNWIRDYFWLNKPNKPKGYWNNYDNCYKAAKECNSKVEFEKKYLRGYTISRKMGWIKDYYWFKRPSSHNKKWTEETCRKEAMKYATKKDFREKSIGAYQVAVNNGYIKDYNWFTNSTRKLKYSEDFILQIIKKFDSRREFSIKESTLYHYSLVHYSTLLDKHLPKFKKLKD